MVPSGVAAHMVRRPAFSEVAAACIQLVEPKKLAYQRKDQWLGGNSRYCESENDIGMMISVGRTRKIITAAASP